MKPTFRGSAAKAGRPSIGAAASPAAVVCKKLRRLIEFTFVSLSTTPSAEPETVNSYAKNMP